MTKAVPASPTLAYLIPGGAFASGQGYYVDRSPRGLLRQLVHRGALCRTGVSWLQPPHPTPNPEAAVRPARGPCGQAMLSRWPPERQAERKTSNPSMPVLRATPRLHALTGPARARGRAGGHQARSARPQCHGRGQHRGEAPELGVRIHCLALGGVDLTSSTGKLTMNVLNAVAEFERDLLVECRLRDGGTVSALACEFNTSCQTIMRVRDAMPAP